MKTILSIILLSCTSYVSFSQKKPQPEFPNLPYVWNKNSDELTLLLKETMEMKADEKTFYKFDGATSRTRIPYGVNVSILVDSTNPTLLKAFRIYKLDVKGKTRQVKIVEAGYKGSEMRDEYVYDYNIKNISGGIHELVISRPLEKGEYALTSGSGSTTYTFSVN